MKAKRIFSLTLACCFAAAALTACGGDPGGSSSGGSSTTANVESEDNGIFELSSDIFGTDSQATDSQTTPGTPGSSSSAAPVQSEPPREYEQ